MNNIENAIIPGLIIIIIITSQIDKRKTFELFGEGVQQGLKNMLYLYPTILGLFFAINLLRSSGLLEFITGALGNILNIINFPKEITGLAILKPISGSASLVYATDLIKEYGPDSRIGETVAIIMGSTETTIYAIAVYTSKIKKKISGKLILLATCGNFLAVILSIIICNLNFY